MGSQQYCLRWNNHQISVMSVFSKLLQSESLVDVTLACEGSRMKAHKVVLSACSPYFQAIFEENPCQHPVVILKGFCLADLKSVIEFIYKGEVNICQQSLSSFLKTAELLQISGLANAASVTSNAQTEADAYSSENAAERDFGASSCSTPSAPTSLTSSTTAACHTAPPSSRSSRSHKNKHRQHDNGKKSKVTKDTTMQQSASDPCVRSDSTLEEESTEDFTVCNIKKDVEDLESEEMEVSPDMSGMNGSMRHAENSHLYNEPHPVTLHPSTSSEGSNVDWTAATPQAETWIGPESAEHKGSFATEGHGVKEETSSNRMRNIKPRCRKQIVPRSRLAARLKGGMHSGLTHYEQFACSYCNQKFTNATNRRRHIKHIHMMEPQLRIHACPICPRAYNRKDNLLFHLRQCHELVPSMLINQESVEAIQVFT